MKVPIEFDDEQKPEEEQAKEAAEEAANESEADEAQPIEPDEAELDEEAMVEAAKRAGAAAAEEELKADADRAREEAGDLLAQLAEAQDALDAAKKDAAQANDRLLRLQADWDNYRKRTAAERLAEKERAAEKLVLSLLPVLDDMERANAHAAETGKDNEALMQYVSGVDAVHDKMIDILEHQGVKVIDPAGEPFDPLAHQAVGRVEDKEAYDETVAQVYQKGYAMGGKIIRSAMVTVTFGGPKRPAPEAETE